MESFSHNLKKLVFKTFYRNQMATFDYDNLFAERRVIVFSITNAYTTCSGKHMEQFEQAHKQLRELGIDDIYVIDSTDWLVGPWADKRSTDIKGLPDRNKQFVSALAQHYNISYDIDELARFWQYIVIINNGEPEKFWYNPFTANTLLRVLKDPMYRYRKLSTDMVLKYLVDKQT
jgi:peroxiredoxin